MRVGLLLVAGVTLVGSALAQAPTDSVTVTSERGQSIERFVQSTASPNRITGKLARWETPICPGVMGAQPAAADVLLKRLREVALAAGVKVDAQSCEPNIKIVFTDTPQITMDHVKQTQPELLGYADDDTAREKLAKVTWPIQGWYATATRDHNGVVRIDAPVETRGAETWAMLPCELGAQYRKPTGPGGALFRPPPGKMCAVRLPAQKFATEASRIRDGLRSVFDHIIIVVDERALAGKDAAAVNDYIALMALAQLSSLDACQPVSSIVNLLPPTCAQAAQALTPADTGYLKGLYGMNADLMAAGQKHAVARGMEQAMGAP